MREPRSFERYAPDDLRLPDLLDLIRRSFAFMEGRIDPPSSIHKLTVVQIAAQCESGEVWVCGTPPKACVFLKPRSGRLYIGKLAVDEALRGQGIARRLIQFVEERARTLGLRELELETRVELTENHETFSKLGFVKSGDGSHAGFDRPTFIVMRKQVC